MAYAAKAIDQFKIASSSKCDFTLVPPTWSDDCPGHHDWCVTMMSGGQKSVVEAETSKRELALMTCK